MIRLIEQRLSDGMTYGSIPKSEENQMKDQSLPLCCCNCMNLISTPDEPYGQAKSMHYSCALRLMLPVRRGTCNRQREKGLPLYGSLKNKPNSRNQLSIFSIRRP